VSKLISEKYPVAVDNGSHFNFTFAILGSIGIILYYVSEMLNRIIFYTPEAEMILPTRTWSMADSGIYMLALFIMAIQLAIWRGVFQSYDFKKKCRNAFIGIVGAGFFTGLFEILLHLMPEEGRLQSDYSVPFMLMILFHLYGIWQLKVVIARIGRMKKVEVGKNIFYILFAANPAIRYLASFIIIIAAPALFINPIFFMYYAELVMVYVTGVIAIGFFIFILLDARKIKIAQMLDLLEKQKSEESEVHAA
jgi:hypothetical protein